eukprot:CAMPEP_0172559106 /NCGR_PEP_ID=MMETSP1067-20121228/82592_1 /TAXON_ID=265564 ORGANISM="Thalassiosira punctigera, Strain Tpunct2005C2" /NCGR_SAMPLE_ID=MMETSP1067 /ASSEMBLY_ACC=CAM_ASM_000444 /LENGTH=244 /DNA_ID=CAMNT_0013348629 /DNA_START=92 /DNA_END=826 /DNA_ORIENTATION=+
MPPRRSGRRSASAYSKGDYIEYQYKGSTVTGQLVEKSTNGTGDKSIWIVNPSDRRRKNEDIPEKALGKIINAEEAMSNRGPKLRKPARVTRGPLSPTSGTGHSNSDGSLEGNGRGSPSEHNPKAGGSATKKRKGDDSNIHDGGKISSKKQKTVTFSRESNKTTALKREMVMKSKRAKTTSTRIGTRSTRGSIEAVLLPDNLCKKKTIRPKKVKKDENVKVVKMLTGTLYLYRGDRPRAEFVRFK